MSRMRERILAYFETLDRVLHAIVATDAAGRSRNILNSVEVARKRGCKIVTLSGFSGDNPLRQGGNVNFYVASGEYGFVEISHLVLCHSILDLAMGWKADAGGAQAMVDAAA